MLTRPFQQHFQRLYAEVLGGKTWGRGRLRWSSRVSPRFLPVHFCWVTTLFLHLPAVSQLADSIDAIYSLPGSLVGAVIEQRVGKKESMSLATLGTALGVIAFVFVSSKVAVMVATMWISFTGKMTMSPPLE